MSPKCKSHTRGNWTKDGDIPCNYDRYQTTAKHKAGKFTTLNEPVIRATFHYPVFMLHIYVHVKVLGTVCHYIQSRRGFTIFLGQLSLGGKLFLLLWGHKDRLLLLCDYVILLCEFYNLDFFFGGRGGSSRSAHGFLKILPK